MFKKTGKTQEVQVNKSSGPNSIPTKILKLAKETLSGALSELINKPFLSGTFPNVFKIARVVPVFKAESRILCSNCKYMKKKKRFLKF